MGAGAVPDDLDAREGEADVGGAGGPQFLARFAPDRRAVREGEGEQTEGDRGGTSECGEQMGGEEVGFAGGRRQPARGGTVRGEVSTLPVIPPVGHGRLGADEQNPPVPAQHPAVVPRPPVQHGHADVDQQPVGAAPFEQRRQRFPAVDVRVRFEIMILAAVSAQFEFRSESIRRSHRFGAGAGEEGALEISVEIEGPLIQVARRDGDDR
mmetsp:Transcript_13136/g.38667  ORF Transcript_13136/g.38667 Transcript_13136/m.38667 type:complete len:210 (+) Transcript_13136:2008-2637(+)